MAPEQTGGRAHEIGPSTDVYGLGAILYALLTGDPPFHDDGTSDVMDRIRTEAPRPVRAARADVPRDLELIGLRALAKDAADRCQSAGELAGDLRSFLAGEPILGSSRWDHVRTWPRSRPRQAAGLTLLVVLLAAAYPAYRIERLLTADRALDSLASWRVSSYPRLLARLDPNDVQVAERLRTLFRSDVPRVKLPAARAPSPILDGAREYALYRALNGTPEALRAMAPLLRDRVPRLFDRLEAELVPRRPRSNDSQTVAARFTPSDRFSHLRNPKRDDADRSRAKGALALMLRGQPDPVYRLLRFDANPPARSFLVHSLGPAGVAPRNLFDRLCVETDDLPSPAHGFRVVRTVGSRTR